MIIIVFTCWLWSCSQAESVADFSCPCDNTAGTFPGKFIVREWACSCRFLTRDRHKKNYKEYKSVDTWCQQIYFICYAACACNWEKTSKTECLLGSGRARIIFSRLWSGFERQNSGKCPKHILPIFVFIYLSANVLSSLQCSRSSEQFITSWLLSTRHSFITTSSLPASCCYTPAADNKPMNESLRPGQKAYNGLTRDRSTLTHDGWAGTSVTGRKKSKEQISTCWLGSCGAAQYVPGWSDHWGEIYGIFIPLDQLWRWLGTKALNSCFPSNYQHLEVLLYILCGVVCEPTQTHTQA